MKSLNHRNVLVNINSISLEKRTDFNYSDKFDKNDIFNPMDEKYDVLDDLLDPIDSKKIVDCVNMLSIIGKGDNEITSESIMLELKRLIIRSIRLDTTNIDTNILDSKLIDTIMSTIKHCIDIIVANRSDSENYFRSIILYNIAVIFDLYSISTSSKESVKLAAFINYFIDAFTKSVK